MDDKGSSVFRVMGRSDLNHPLTAVQWDFRHELGSLLL
jgi:hypothetical protein